MGLIVLPKQKIPSTYITVQYGQGVRFFNELHGQGIPGVQQFELIKGLPRKVQKYKECLLAWLAVPLS